MTNVSIYGRLTKDPDIRVTKDDENFYVLFTIASKQGPNKTSFIPCTAFGKTAEVIGNYFKKAHAFMPRAICSPIIKRTVRNSLE